MKKEFAMLAHTYSGEFAHIGWYASRKFNGWGCIWDGGITRGKIASEVPWYYKGGDREGVIATGLWSIGRADKNGMRPKVIHAPNWFLDSLPEFLPLHGELWFNDNLSFIKETCGCSHSESANWIKVQYVVYNSKPYSLFPGLTQTEDNWLNTVYKVRLRKIHEAHILSPEQGVWAPAQQTPVTSHAHLLDMIDEAKAKSWEGLMLTNPLAYYEDRRSYNLLKIKPDFETEATIIGYEDGKTGKNIGKLGALWAELTWDDKVLSYTGGDRRFVGRTVRFKISGMRDEERYWGYAMNKWPVGGEVNFKFSCVSTHGVPMSCNVES